ncbi:MAG: dUTP diphosphatase [Alphaproteobacteria bacterium]|nr:dUTP diphosphatase [Alphaproteobacteria bacterium]
MSAHDGPEIRIQKLPHFDGLSLPSYATAGAAGMDVEAAVEADTLLAPGRRAAVPTGLAMAIPAGFEIQVRPRSGLALKHGVTVANTPGTIDSDYRGEVKIMLINLGEDDFIITRGMRIAQLVVAPVSLARLAIADTLETTDRGSGGFGSTGV